MLCLLRALLWCPGCFAGLDCRLLPLHWLILHWKVQCQTDCLGPSVQVSVSAEASERPASCPTPLPYPCASLVQKVQNWLDLHIGSRIRAKRPEMQSSCNPSGAVSQSLCMHLQPMQDEPQSCKSWGPLQKESARVLPYARKKNTLH